MGIKALCHNKRILYMSCRESDDTDTKQHKKKLQDINTCYTNRKKKYYDELISKSNNKTKTTWKIIKKTY